MSQALVVCAESVCRRRHCDAPFALPRERYLQHCADLGEMSSTLKGGKTSELRWVARLLPPNAPQGVGMQELGSWSGSGYRFTSDARPDGG
jgi:hypothetical protein